MTTIAITVEGVLRRPVGGQPIPQGVDLYYGLATRAKLVLLTDEVEETELDHWLRIEGLHEHSLIIWNQLLWGEPSSSDVRRTVQVGEAKRRGHDVTLVIEPDPAVSAQLLRYGYNTLTFSHAQYAVPEWRPDYDHDPVPWDTLSQQIASEAYMRANDSRKVE